MEFREAKIEEVHTCEEVLRAAFGAYVQRLGRQQSDDAYSWLPIAVSERRVLVAVDVTAIQGVAIYSSAEDVWNIDQIAVRPGNQGNGIGSGLIGRIECEAKASGIRLLMLDTAEIMTDLLRLYDRHGFAVIRRGPPKHGRDNHVRVFFQKAI